ncbi:hypothetical protein DVH24_006130 [Malus domestica]|uniref:Protein BZR1 homolog n=1 Tax=Malus domestica TaxID=3750 RepID=A0A498J5K8_MALDO|nr:hypothetical protein DVH24_006130 [Malus domestica]
MARTSGSKMSESEKEKTKMKERQRRAITTKIFHDLRKHSGYRLISRGDINKVIRHLATEVGWLVEPDGNTYRPPNVTHLPIFFSFSFPLLSYIFLPSKVTTPVATATPTPSSSVVIGGGECSTTASSS